MYVLNIIHLISHSLSWQNFVIYLFIYFDLFCQVCHTSCSEQWVCLQWSPFLFQMVPRKESSSQIGAGVFSRQVP